MEFFRRAERPTRNVGVLPGTFNPVTVAHLALADAALNAVDEVVFVLPRSFPHKQFTGASFEQRVGMLKAALKARPAFSIGASDGGLFAEIAEEIRQFYPSGVLISLICGRDAAERVAGWDYGRPGAFAEMLQRFDLLVAARQGTYTAPTEFASAVRQLALPCELDDVSATQVRERIAHGEAWEHLVPVQIVDEVRRIYGHC